jgi:hypothetical protein
MKNIFAALLIIPFAFCSTAVAIEVTSVTVSGPGGFGSGSPLVNYANTDLTYTNTDYLDIAISVDEAGNYNLYEAEPTNFLLNSSGASWAGIKFINMTPELGKFFPFWYDSGNVFSGKTISDDLVTFFAGSLPNGSDASAPIGAYTYTGDGPGTFIIRQVPIAVPEPSTLALAVAGGVLLLWKRSRRAN